MVRLALLHSSEAEGTVDQAGARSSHDWGERALRLSVSPSGSGNCIELPRGARFKSNNPGFLCPLKCSSPWPAYSHFPKLGISRARLDYAYLLPHASASFRKRQRETHITHMWDAFLSHFNQPDTYLCGRWTISWHSVRPNVLLV